MFAVFCPECRRRYLMPLTEIRGLVSTADGIEVTYRCPRGHHGTWVPRRH